MKPSVVAILKGGLGNQLFGYAAARAFALRSGRELWLDDYSGFARDGYGRRWRLGGFPLAGGPAPDALRLGDPKRARHKLVRTFDRLLPAVWRCYLAERPGQGARQLNEFRSCRKVVHLNGYWQDEACFADHAAAVRRELEPPPCRAPADRDLERRLAGCDSVFVHVRRQRYTPRLAADYYENAIEAARAALPGCVFALFGDDPEWARTRLSFGGAEAIEAGDPAGDELRDFRLMAACRHAIVANSSFSWWAAWLRPHPEKRVWTPADSGWPVVPAGGWTRVANSLE
jgi:hypothetical protein